MILFLTMLDMLLDGSMGMSLVFVLRFCIVLSVRIECIVVRPICR